jgi:hypothetical protein
MYISALFSVAALLVAEASAHGAVTSYVIDGTTYPGYAEFSPITKATKTELIVLLGTRVSLQPHLLLLFNDNGPTIILLPKSPIQKLCAMEEPLLLLLQTSLVAL